MPENATKRSPRDIQRDLDAAREAYRLFPYESRARECERLYAELQRASA